MEVIIFLLGGEDSDFSGPFWFISGLICTFAYVFIAPDILRVMQLIAEKITMYAQNPFVILGFVIGTVIMSFIKYSPANTFCVGNVCAIILIIGEVVENGWNCNFFLSIFKILYMISIIPLIAFFVVAPVLDFLASLLTLPLAIVSKKHRRNLGYSCDFIGYIGVGMLGVALNRWLNLYYMLDSDCVLRSCGLNDINFILDGVDPMTLVIIGVILVIISIIAIKKTKKRYRHW